MLNSGKHQQMVEAVSTLSVKELMANQDDSDRRSDYSMDQSVSPPPAYSRGSGVTATSKLIMATVIVVSMILGACIVAAAYAARQSHCHCPSAQQPETAFAAFADRLSAAAPSFIQQQEPISSKTEEIVILANELGDDSVTTAATGLVEAEKDKSPAAAPAVKEEQAKDSAEESTDGKKKKKKSKKSKKNKRRNNKNRRGNKKSKDDDDEDEEEASNAGPVIFQLDDLARTILDHEERAMMNCVLEKRRPHPFMPFDSPRALKVFCRGGRDEPFGPVVAIASTFSDMNNNNNKDDDDMPIIMRPLFNNMNNNGYPGAPLNPAAILARTIFQRRPAAANLLRQRPNFRVLPPFPVHMHLENNNNKPPGPMMMDSLESAVMKALGPLEFILNQEVLGPKPEPNTRKPAHEEEAKPRHIPEEMPMPFEVESPPVGPETGKPNGHPQHQRPLFNDGPLARLARRPGFLAGLFPPPPHHPLHHPMMRQQNNRASPSADDDQEPPVFPFGPMMDDNNNNNNKARFIVHETHHHHNNNNNNNNDDDETEHVEHEMTVHHVRRGMLPLVMEDEEDQDEDEGFNNNNNNSGPSSVMRPPSPRAARFLSMQGNDNDNDGWNSEPSTPALQPHFIQPRSLRRRGPVPNRHF